MRRCGYGYPTEYVTERFVTELEGKKLEAKMKGLTSQVEVASTDLDGREEALKNVSLTATLLESQVEAHGQFLHELHTSKMDKEALKVGEQVDAVLAQLDSLFSRVDSFYTEKCTREVIDHCKVEKVELEKELIHQFTQKLEGACAPVCVTILAAVTESGDPK